MTRMVLATGDLSPALAELKHWLGITRSADDVQLTALIGAGVEACEAFTGLTPLAATVEERFDASHEWARLVTRPIAQVAGVEMLDADGARALLGDDEYDLHLSGDGSAQLRLRRGPFVSRVVATLEAGLATDWAHLPDGLRHGILRFAAYLHREGEASLAEPPAAIAALWRPWRVVRLA
ncbi:head-tail connector protein [Citromicrobium bathyomarinum]|uniref:head-tail connector protein n=1 Tax=Citromicrobium bathyomarinum TaxID=72174 RepID=UPI00315A782E